MKKILYILPAMLLVFACGQEEPVDDTTVEEAGVETMETADTTAEDAPLTAITARHILVCYDGCAVEGSFNRTQDEALALIEDIDSKIQSEELDFTQAAINYSDCPSSVDGGMLGEFGRGMMVPAFEEAAFALPVNGKSGVVETQFGYHLIYRDL